MPLPRASRPLRTALPLLVPWTLAALAGCGDDGGTSTTGTGKPTLSPVVRIAVDASRDGVADPNDPADHDFASREKWDATHGASFLANVDDDDGDHARDAENDQVDGDADALDLAPIVIAPWPDAPDAAVGTLTLGDAESKTVRVFQKAADGTWTDVGGAMGPCATPIVGADDTGAAACASYATTMTFTAADLRAGITLGIEARRFRVSETDPWDGFVRLDWSIADGAGKAYANADGSTSDTAVLRVAPWVLFGNLSPFDTVWSAGSSPEFVADMTGPIKKAGLTYNKIPATSYNDQWTQDFMQTAWTAMPGPGGVVQGMRIANPRPWAQPGNVLPVKWLLKNYLGADRGVFQIYAKDDTGTSYDSHGNHDLLPPYQNGSDDFPLGRIVHGSDILPETHAFYAAQAVQGPPVTLDTSWLFVGHIDEFLSYVPAKTPRGWKLLYASAPLAKSMLEKAQTDGLGSTLLFAGQERYDASGGVSLIPAQITIDALLASTDIMQWSEEAQADIDMNVATLKSTLGLADDEIIAIPTLFEQDCDGGFCGKLAYTPGTVNELVFGDTVVMPKPFGPIVGGSDLFEKDLQDRLGGSTLALGSTGNGLSVNFADDWYDYHILAGEVHCGSNPEAGAPFDEKKWWEVSK
jgi:protein-arginine deiminase